MYSCVYHLSQRTVLDYHSGTLHSLFKIFFSPVRSVHLNGSNWSVASATAAPLSEEAQLPGVKPGEAQLRIASCPSILLGLVTETGQEGRESSGKMMAQQEGRVRFNKKTSIAHADLNDSLKYPSKYS
jgi:hypothetical protein